MSALVEKLTSRDCLTAALNHKQPNRIPIDFGGPPSPECTPVASLRFVIITDLKSAGAHPRAFSDACIDR